MKSIRRRRVAAVTALLLLALAVLAVRPMRRGQEAASEGNLIRNGDFSAVTNGMPDEWNTGMWVTSAGASYLEAATLPDGTTAALVENAARNDARFEQTVAVQPNTTYRLSARVCAEGCEEGRVGANVSFLGIYGTSECAYDTDGAFTTLTLYARTGSDQHEATVCARVGGYGSEAQGKAWFTDVELTATDDVPIGAQVLSIAPQEPARDSAEEAEEGAAPSLTIPALLIAAAVYLAIAWAIASGALRAGARENLDPRRGWRGELAALLAAAGALRVALAFAVEGYGVDMGCFTAWAMRMAEVGPRGFYESGYFCDYPPAYMLVLGLFGAAANLFGFPLTGALGQGLLKLTPIVCDLLLAAVVFAVASREAGRRPALGIAALIAANPAFIVAGSCWGQIDALLAVMLCLMLLLAREGKWHAAIPLFALAVLAKPQAGLLAPLGVAALIRALMRGDRARSGKSILTGIGVALALTLAVVLPFALPQNPVTWLIDLYGRTLFGYKYATLSTGNLMFLLGGNWVETDTALLGGITYGQIGAAMMALSFAAGIAVYLLGQGNGFCVEKRTDLMWAE